MKIYIRSLTFFLFVIGVFFCKTLSLKAAVMDENFDMQKLQGKKLGYYIGSFDPIHLGHQYVIETALQKKHVDFVLVFPAPGGDSFKNRTALHVRQKMIASIYNEHPQVLFTYWTPKELQDRFSEIANNVEIVGIIGSDVITEKLMGPNKELSSKYQKVFMRGIPLTEKHYEDTVGGLMALKATSFLAGVRGDIDLSFLNGKVHDRKIKAFIQSKENSSTKVRKAIMTNQPFEHLLAFPVQSIIKEEGLYGFQSKLNKELQKEILEMQEKDQFARMSIANIKNPSQKQFETIAKVDMNHNQRLKEIVNHYRWPGVSVIGLKGSSAMWLLVQHQDQDLDFQKKCLEYLKEAVDAHESLFSNYAYLVDRVRMNEKLPQIYGTQWIQEDGKFILYSVEDITNLDIRRFEAGLCSIDDYKEEIKKFYHLKDEDF